MATSDPVLSCAMEWAGLECSLRSSLGACQCGHRKPVSLQDGPLSTLTLGQASTGTHLTNGVQDSHGPPVSLSGIQPSKEACLPCVGHQDWGAQSVVLTAQSPWQVFTQASSHFPWVASQGHRSWPNLPLLPDYMWYFLQSWLYRSPSASFQLVFSVSCSTYRCIFYVFVVEEVSSLSSYSTILIDLWFSILYHTLQQSS